MTVPVTIMWFRKDLRVKDNPALIAACNEGKIIPVFIYDSEAPDNHRPGGASQWWLHQSLHALNKRLNDHLQIYQGDPKAIIPDLMDKFSADTVIWNRCYEPATIERDKQLKEILKASSYKAHSVNGSLLWEPWTISKGDGGPYKVFTPFYKKGCLQAAPPRYPEAAPDRITYADVPNSDLSVDDLNLMPDINWYEAIANEWTPGEDGAADRLSAFLNDAATEYKSDRDIPGVHGTSKLSPHLHWGEISPNQIWYAVKGKFGDTENEGVDTFLSELGWREFSYHLLYHFPQIVDENFNDKFNHFNWRYSEQDLKAWQKGLTGIPIVDAGMRQLWQTGWMHNRVRMIVGSFLVKNLLMHWHHGEAWFWDTLVDADMASNSASWQWVAGSGADAAPYFRVFNPVLQGEKFDKQGHYVKAWCPELAKLGNKYLHKPWEASKDELSKAGITLGQEYPEPLVDLKESRRRALDAFDQIKGK